MLAWNVRRLVKIARQAVSGFPKLSERAFEGCWCVFLIFKSHILFDPLKGRCIYKEIASPRSEQYWRTPGHSESVLASLHYQAGITEKVSRTHWEWISRSANMITVS